MKWLFFHVANVIFKDTAVLFSASSSPSDQQFIEFRVCGRINNLTTAFKRN